MVKDLYLHVKDCLLTSLEADNGLCSLSISVSEFGANYDKFQIHLKALVHIDISRDFDYFDLPFYLGELTLKTEMLSDQELMMQCSKYQSNSKSTKKCMYAIGLWSGS